MPQDPQEGGKTITFGGKELDPNEEAAYRERIRKAKASGGVHALKGNEPVGSVPRPSIPLHRKAEDDNLASALTPEGGVQPRPPGSPILSPQTASMLQAAADAQLKQTAEEKKAEEEQKEEVAREDLLEAFDFQGRNEAERILNNKKRRIAIESRCKPMNIEDLLLKDEVVQVVPILPDKFEVTFRSMTPEENLYIKQYIAKNDQEKSDQYVLEKFALCQLACSVMAINGKAFPEHRNSDGSPSDALFEIKLKMLLKKSGYVIADLGINYMWFDIRVRRLLNPELLGNG
jgi:hypothetical protein